MATNNLRDVDDHAGNAPDNYADNAPDTIRSIRDFNAHGLLTEDPIRQMLDHTLLPLKSTDTAKALHR